MQAEDDRIDDAQRERAERELQRAEAEYARAELELRNAQEERAAKDSLAAKLRSLGIDPMSVLKPAG